MKDLESRKVMNVVENSAKALISGYHHVYVIKTCIMRGMGANHE